MLERCVVAQCGNTNDPENNISMHRIPFFDETCTIKQRRRKKCIDFMLERRKMWVPGKTSSLCSLHFKEEDFIRPLNPSLKMKRDLKRDDIGVCVYPARYIKWKAKDHEPPSKRSREKRMVRNQLPVLKTFLSVVIILKFIILPHTVYSQSEILNIV